MSLRETSGHRDRCQLNLKITRKMFKIFFLISIFYCICRNKFFLLIIKVFNAVYFI